MTGTRLGGEAVLKPGQVFDLVQLPKLPDLAGRRDGTRPICTTNRFCVPWFTGEGRRGSETTTNSPTREPRESLSRQALQHLQRLEIPILELSWNRYEYPDVTLTLVPLL